MSARTNEVQLFRLVDQNGDPAQLGQISAAGITDSTAVGRALLTGATAAAQRASLGVDARRAIADADCAIVAADAVIAYTSLTADRVATLPLASAVNAGKSFLVLDESGSATSTPKITVTAAGSDNIGAGTTAVINSAYGSKRLVSNGVSKWFVV